MCVALLGSKATRTEANMGGGGLVVRPLFPRGFPPRDKVENCPKCPGWEFPNLVLVICHVQRGQKHPQCEQWPHGSKCCPYGQETVAPDPEPNIGEEVNSECRQNGLAKVQVILLVDGL